MTEGQLIHDIETGLADQLNGHIETGITNKISRGHNNASDIGMECDTYQAACRLKGELRPRTSLFQAKIFRIGNLMERPNLRWLQDARFKLREANDKRFFWPTFDISGYLDADIMIPQLPSPYDKMWIPFEHKTISPNGFRAVKKIKRDGGSLTKADQPWIRKYPGQLETYKLFKNVEWGLWFFYEKVTGDFLFWLSKLDYEYADTCLKRAERTNKNVANGIIPDPVFCDLCKKCDFALTLCFPDKDFGPGFDISFDEWDIDQFDRYFELDPMASEHSAIWKSMIGNSGSPGKFYGRNVVLGDYMIEAKPQSRIFNGKESSFFRMSVNRLVTPESVTDGFLD